jgi:hypothetical protein
MGFEARKARDLKHVQATTGRAWQPGAGRAGGFSAAASAEGERI